MIWLFGHVERVEDGRMLNKLMLGNMYGVRKRRRSSKTWNRDVKKSFKAIGVRRQKE